MCKCTPSSVIFQCATPYTAIATSLYGCVQGINSDRVAPGHQAALEQLRHSVQSGITAGFQLATAAGPLCDEPMWGVAFEVRVFWTWGSRVYRTLVVQRGPAAKSAGCSPPSQCGVLRWMCAVPGRPFQASEVPIDLFTPSALQVDARVRCGADGALPALAEDVYGPMSGQVRALCAA